MLMLVDCSNCRTPLQLPPGAQSIRCALCHAITRIADPRALPPPTTTTSTYHHPPPPPPPQAPSPYYQAPPGQPPSASGQKRAVIIGISYERSRNELKGCVNDAKCMKYMLVNKFNFPESSIVMLTEEEKDPYRRPTKHSIRLAMHWLVQGCQPGDSLVFHFSGHGSQQRNYNGDELDGYDETLCPLDFETQGMIVDDEINATIVKPLPRGVKLHAIIDACHSGTMLDLPYLCRMDRSGRYVWEDHRPRSGVWKGTNGGEVISFSGCDDDQTSADTSALSKVTSTGAMTFSFIQAIERGHATTYGDMLTAMRSTIRKTDSDIGGGGVVTSLLTMLLTGGSLGFGNRQVVGWRLSNGGVIMLQCLWKLRDFKFGVELITRIYKVVEATGHFPNLRLEQPNQIRAELWTPSIGGLSMNDFIVAAKIDEIQTSDLVPRKRAWA